MQCCFAALGMHKSFAFNRRSTPNADVPRPLPVQDSRWFRWLPAESREAIVYSIVWPAWRTRLGPYTLFPVCKA